MSQHILALNPAYTKNSFPETLKETFMKQPLALPVSPFPAAVHGQPAGQSVPRMLAETARLYLTGVPHRDGLQVIGYDKVGRALPDGPPAAQYRYFWRIETQRMERCTNAEGQTPTLRPLSLYRITSAYDVVAGRWLWHEVGDCRFDSLGDLMADLPYIQNALDDAFARGYYGAVRVSTRGLLRPQRSYFMQRADGEVLLYPRTPPLEL